MSGSANSSPPPIVTTANSGEKPFDVMLLFFDEALGDEQRNADVLMPVALKRRSSAP